MAKFPQLSAATAQFAEALQAGGGLSDKATADAWAKALRFGDDSQTDLGDLAAKIAAANPRSVPLAKANVAVMEALQHARIGNPYNGQRKWTQGTGMAIYAPIPGSTKDPYFNAAHYLEPTAPWADDAWTKLVASIMPPVAPAPASP